MYIVVSEYEIKKFKFIGCVFDISLKEDVKKYEFMFRKEYKKSMYICYVYLFYSI